LFIVSYLLEIESGAFLGNYTKDYAADKAKRLEKGIVLPKGRFP